MQSAPGGAPTSAEPGGTVPQPQRHGVPVAFVPWAGPPPGTPHPVQPYLYAGAPGTVSVLGPPPPRDPRRRRTTLAVVGVLVIALVAVGGVLAVGARNRAAAEAAALDRARARIEKELPRLLDWVSTDRGLAWKSTVRPEVLSDHDFVRALMSGGTGGTAGADAAATADPDDVGTTLAAMGLVPSADDFYGADDQATADGVVGFYDDQTQRLVVRGTTWSPSMEYTLVHELTHALQDQNFDLGAMKDATRSDDESADASRAVIEGDAERVADDYYSEQDTTWQDALDAAEGSSAPSSQPIVDTIDAMPYVVGSDFVVALADAGGNAAVDKAFRTPPTTSQQLLHPTSWLAGHLPAPAKVTPPSPDGAESGSVADRGVLGQLGLWLTVDGTNPRLKDTKALDGWDGDAYVATGGDGSPACFVDQVHFADAAGRATALKFLTPWVTAQHVDARQQGASDLRLSACS